MPTKRKYLSKDQLTAVSRAIAPALTDQDASEEQLQPAALDKIVRSDGSVNTTALKPSNVLGLQRTMGNRAVMRMLATRSAEVASVVQRVDVKEQAALNEMIAKLDDKTAMAKFATTITAVKALAKMREAGINFRRRFELVLTYWTTITLTDLKTDIDVVSQPERDSVWKDTKLMAQAKAKLPVQQYLSLLPALRVFKEGTTAEDGKTHTKAADADKLIQDKMGAYVADAVKAGKQVSGFISVVDGADWDLAYEKEFGDDGEQAITNAFVDHPPDGSPGRIWLHKTRGNAGTAIHEGMHKYSANGVIGLSQPLNEGVTEYFTRLICDNLTPPISRGNYQSNYDLSVELVKAVTKDTMAKAYFDGDIANLKKAFLNGNTRSEADWTNFLNLTKQNKWAEAEAILNP